MAPLSRETGGQLPYRFRELKASLRLASQFSERETRHTKAQTHSNRVTNTFGEQFPELVSSLIEREVEVVVDAGVSMGLTTVEIAARFPNATRVVGLDINEGVLGCEEDDAVEYYSRKYGLKPEDLRSRVHWVRTDAYLPPLPHQSVDLLVWMNNLFFAIRHNRLGHRELSLILEHQLQTLKPGGLFAISGDKTYALFQTPRHSEEQIRRVGVHVDKKAPGYSSNRSAMAHLTTILLRLNARRDIGEW